MSKLIQENECKIFSPIRVATPVCRASYVKLLTPSPSFDGTPKYSISLILDPNTMDLNPIKQAILAMATEKFKIPLNPWPKHLRMPLKNGNDRVNKSTGKVDPAYAGKYYINASSKTKPDVGIIRNGEYVRLVSDEEVYSGMWVRATLTAFAFETQVNSGISFALNNVLKVRDGERLDNRRSGDEDFNGAEFGESQVTIDPLATGNPMDSFESRPQQPDYTGYFNQQQPQQPQQQSPQQFNFSILD